VIDDGRTDEEQEAEKEPKKKKACEKENIRGAGLLLAAASLQAEEMEQTLLAARRCVGSRRQAGTTCKMYDCPGFFVWANHRIS
jgi:hypothetical protein